MDSVQVFVGVARTLAAANDGVVAGVMGEMLTVSDRRWALEVDGLHENVAPEEALLTAGVDGASAAIAVSNVCEGGNLSLCGLLHPYRVMDCAARER